MKNATVLEYWADRIEEGLNDSHFTLSKFLIDNKLAAEMLVIEPNDKMCNALVKCPDFSMNPFSRNIIQFRWATLKLILQQKKISENMRRELIQTQNYAFNALLLYLDYYDVKELHKLIIKYCENNGAVFNVHLISKLLRQIITNIENFDDREIKILIQYAVKNKIIQTDIFLALIRYKSINLLLHIIKLYRSPTIILGDCIVDGNTASNLKRLYILNQNIKVLDLDNCIGNCKKIYKKIVLDDMLVHVLLWLDEKQRFSRVKDTTLLDFNCMATHIKDYLYDVNEDIDVLDYSGEEHEWGDAPLEAQAW